ncbi:hypothetical protein AXF42_Ash020119 [Apostasia shenzhenica]|uniref:SAP30-binding protein n=1 Tax=Apostasia shenzhenica TaxID=1088818 RepID=A0A2I0A3P9_9ASPA|nr:hypothetical protein AXF42_Ash020119 [Apostasia shenzhenica]
MAAETEGIALLSMYGDEEEEEEEEEVTSATDAAAAAAPLEESGAGEDSEEISTYGKDGRNRIPLPIPDKPFLSPSPLRPQNETDSKTLTSPLQQQPTPQPTPPRPPSVSRSQFFSPSSLVYSSPASAILEPIDGRRAIRGALAIVDYAHDETAVSPEAEVMEIESSGRVIIATELQNFDGMTRLNSHSPTPNSQHEPSQQPKSEANVVMDYTGTEPVVGEAEASTALSLGIQKDGTSKMFLPPPFMTKCSDELQEKINRFLAYKLAGKSFNADLRNRKDYRNPDFLLHAVRYQDIDQIGTCFDKDVFDPHGYAKSDYYDEIEADMKRELERKEQERKRSQKIDFVSGGAQTAGVGPALKMNTQISGN